MRSDEIITVISKIYDLKSGILTAGYSREGWGNNCESAETEQDEDIMVWKLYLRKAGGMIWQLDLKLNIIGIK